MNDERNWTILTEKLFCKGFNLDRRFWMFSKRRKLNFQLWWKGFSFEQEFRPRGTAKLIGRQATQSFARRPCNLLEETLILKRSLDQGHRPSLLEGDILRRYFDDNWSNTIVYRSLSTLMKRALRWRRAWTKCTGQAYWKAIILSRYIDDKATPLSTEKPLNLDEEAPTLKRSLEQGHLLSLLESDLYN